jgi:hypothetical protein
MVSCSWVALVEDGDDLDQVSPKYVYWKKFIQKSVLIRKPVTIADKRTEAFLF